MQVYHPTKGAKIPLLNSDNRKVRSLFIVTLLSLPIITVMLLVNKLLSLKSDK